MILTVLKDLTDMLDLSACAKKFLCGTNTDFLCLVDFFSAINIIFVHTYDQLSLTTPTNVRLAVSLDLLPPGLDQISACSN